MGQFGVHIDGAMPDVMTLIDMKPLNYPTKFGIDPKTTGGQASADLAFKVPMLADLPVDDVGIAVKAEVSDFAVTLGGHTRLTDGAVTFDIDNSHLHQSGMVNLADARLNVDWTEDFRTKDPVTTRLAVKGAMTEGGRQALNIGLMRFLPRHRAHHRRHHRPSRQPDACRCHGGFHARHSVGAHRQSGKDARARPRRGTSASISRPAMWCRTRPSASPGRC